jgi:transaldolase
MRILKNTWRFNDNTKHGWTTNPYSITCRKFGVHSATIANIPNRKTISDEERKANALLIAAAPDLLMALEAVVQGVPDTWEGVQKARRAIAKAYGEGIPNDLS